MGRYKLAFRKSVALDMRYIPSEDARKILAAIESLSEDPRPEGSEKLSGQERYRVRRGDYGIVHELRDDDLTALIVKVGHRKDVYRRGR